MVRFINSSTRETSQQPTDLRIWGTCYLDRESKNQSPGTPPKCLSFAHRLCNLGGDHYIDPNADAPESEDDCEAMTVAKYRVDFFRRRRADYFWLEYDHQLPPFPGFGTSIRMNQRISASTP